MQHLGLALVGSVELTNLRSWRSSTAARAASTTAPAAASGRRIVDLSHRIREGLITYPGLPAPVITPHLTREASREKYAPGTEFAIDLITMIGNTGTYLDSPFHRYEGGADLAGLDLATLVDLPAEVFHLTDVAPGGDGRAASRPRCSSTASCAARPCCCTPDGTRTSARPRTRTGAPFLSTEGVAHLVEQGVALVGIDCLNIDDTESGGERPAHTRAAGGGHPRRRAPDEPRGAARRAGPASRRRRPPVEEFGTFPVRAFATGAARPSSRLRARAMCIMGVVTQM